MNLIEAANGCDNVRNKPRRSWVVIGCMTSVAAVVLLSQALFHGHLSGIDEYDDGVYFGAAVQLAHGIMPYRDFGFIQPPMIVVLLSPFALVSRLVGTAMAFEGARLFVVVIAVANTALVGILLRHRSRGELIVAMGAMAFYPGAVSSAQTILLEPVLVLFCLIALVALFEGTNLTENPRRVMVAGVFFGIATSTKLWALLPLAIAIYLLRRRGRRQGVAPMTARILGGATLGFGLICLPFVVAAPGAFMDQVLITQAVRQGGGYTLPERLVDLSGLAGTIHLIIPRLLDVAVAIVAAVGAVAVVMAYRRRGTPIGELERYALLVVAGGACMLILSPTYYYHYSGFVAPFIAVSAGFIFGRLTAFTRSSRTSGSTRIKFGPAVLLLSLIPLGLMITGTTDMTRIVNAPQASQVDDALSDSIPSRGCVLYIDPTIALLDNRFTSDVSRCADVVDYLGVERILDQGRAYTVSDQRQLRLQKQMLAWIQASDALIISNGPTSWGVKVANYVREHFTEVHDAQSNISVYLLRDHRSSKQL